MPKIIRAEVRVSAMPGVVIALRYDDGKLTTEKTNYCADEGKAYVEKLVGRKLEWKQELFDVADPKYRAHIAEP